MAGVARRSPRDVVCVESAIKKCGATKQWSAALQLFAEASRRSSAVAPGCYLAAAGACGKGRQWQRALALLCQAWETRMERNVTLSYSVGTSACEKGGQWQRALALLGDMRESRLEPNATGHP
ncbi:unnamed protein product [Prorocentrum cordatum]|uniref:Pentatricopeptide repeat-containing protein, chloroplastic n=1 Tax=Prorocentrum cordatum TaxID=2364126 RepID=A0ABN9QQZ4_9DINO|nr:unnamed protein product [Polarella glacialis]